MMGTTLCAIRTLKTHRSSEMLVLSFVDEESEA